ncbi:MAG: tRNA lysidine(34) synthetase TilS [Eubacterium sp.]|nr:tRNA lysidine(34) synthetase TilS [Eubacterium sp.]
MPGTLVKNVREYTERYRMIDPGDTVVIGLSGGADSVCLLLLLQEFFRCRHTGRDASGQEERQVPGEEPEMRLYAVHVNHQLRREEADEDEAFVRALCERRQIPLDVYRYPVAEMAAEKGIGTEEAGRMARQEAYADCLKKHGAHKLALAHHANDRAETFLFHAVRGTSLAGLASICPVQAFIPGTHIVRPLLGTTREEIEQWLEEEGQTWCTDATNADESYTRNAIRHTVIPYLQEHVNVQAVRHLTEAASDLEEADSFLKTEAAQRSGKYIRKEEAGRDRVQIHIMDSLLGEPAVLQGYILLDVLEQLCGMRKDLGREQVRSLQQLFRMQTGRRLDLPYGLGAARDYGGICIWRKAEESREQIPAPVPVAGDGTCTWGAWQFVCRILDAPESPFLGNFTAAFGAIPQKKYTKWLDYDKINGNLCIRSRRAGDRLVVHADGGSRKLKEYLIDEKVPGRLRDMVPVLASGSDVYWIIGYRISEDSKVTAGTRRILEISAARTDF